MNNALENNISQKNKNKIKNKTSDKNKMFPSLMSHQLHDDMLSFLPETRCNARLYDGNIWLFTLLLLLFLFDIFTATERQRGGSDHYKGCNHLLLTDRGINSPSIYIRMKVCAARGYSDSSPF